MVRASKLGKNEGEGSFDDLKKAGPADWSCKDQ